MSVLSLADAKKHLNITASTDDAELQTVIDAAEGVIARRVGPLTPTPLTVRVHGWTDTLVLPVAPVISLSTVTPVGGTALDVSALDASGGLVTYANDAWGYFGAALYDVAYEAGRAEVSADLLFGVKEMVRHLWKTQRGANGRPGSADSANVPGYLMPYAVADLIGPYELPGVA